MTLSGRFSAHGFASEKATRTRWIASAWCKGPSLLLIQVNHGDVDLLHLVPPFRLRPIRASSCEKKTGVAEHPQGFDHVGLLVNEPPRPAGLLFI